jgi:hypothetical protein
LLACVSVAVVLGACASNNPVPYAREYPESPQRLEVLDIQVFRSAKHIELTNTTAQAFGPSTIWLNMHYSRPIDGLAVGQTLRLPLSSFRNEFSEAFRGGGFFAPEKPERLVLAELEPVAQAGDDPEKPRFYRLIVVGGEAD